MKSLIFPLLIIFSLFSTHTTAQNTIQDKELNPGTENEVSTIILIRHAEKAEAHLKDPSLSEVGKERAEVLVQLFKDTPIALFYTTPYKRTTETITPIAKANDKEVFTYNPSDKNSIAEMMLSGKGKRMLIVGHSNTIPQLVNSLIGKNEFTTLNENDYGKLFIVVFKGKELIDYSVLNY